MRTTRENSFGIANEEKKKMSMIVSEIKFTGPLWLAAEGRLLGPGVVERIGIGREAVAMQVVCQRGAASHARWA